ncbi:MAG: DUF2398 family protein, partial [Sciscionella sp.]
DIVFPGQSTSSRIALLALPRLLAEGTPSQGLEEGRSPPERATRADGRIAVTRGQIGIACAEISAAYPTAWAKQSSENLPALTEEVVRLWRALGLVEPAPEPRTPRGDGSAEWWLLSPAAHRWLPQPDDTPRTEAPNTDDAAPDWPAEASLFDPPPASAGDDPIGERNPPASTGTQEGINR